MLRGVRDLKKKDIWTDRSACITSDAHSKGCMEWNLEDEMDFASIALKPNQQVLLMGTADIVSTPSALVTFVEDMTSERKALIGVALPVGLQNMGNTCCMNSTFQCVRYI